MLLSNLIASHQETYADIQAKIDELQEQQRKIQAYLQQLGSVESQMVSAVQMLQEAIFSINEVCPDQLAEYQQTVAGLFSSPVAMLESSQPEPQPEPTPNPEPEQPSNATENKPTDQKDSLFKFKISHGGDYITYWTEDDDELVTTMFKDLKIRPRDKKPTDGYNPFAGDGVVYVAYLTSKAFAKIEDKADYLNAYEEFKSVALAVYDKLNYEHNLNNLVPIYRIRRAIGERVNRTEFNDFLLEMQADDIFQLQGGTVEDNARDKIEDSISTELNGLRCYAKRLKP